MTPETQRWVWGLLALPGLLGIAYAILLMVRGSLIEDDPEVGKVSESWVRQNQYDKDGYDR